MNTDWNLSTESLKFFGKVTATVAHELNNTIGIINENAGLMEDLGLMAKQGHPADIDKWISICKKISEQVKNSHETISSLNRFAHCTDEEKKTVNPEILLNLVLNLLKRPLAQIEVSAEVLPAEEPIEIYIRHFLFLKLMGECLLYAADNADQNKKIIISINSDAKRLGIKFSGVNKTKSNFHSNTIEEVLKILDAKITQEEGKICLLFFLDKHDSENN
ncbi:MAG: hypothetical protein GY760_11485 [Deltaproteobacteria bacterium]|nr:hypothetical protein [Deltaproteobacteria bacterium]